MSEKSDRDLRLLRVLLYCVFASAPVSIAIAQPLSFLCVLLWLYGLRRADARQALKTSPYAIPVLAFVAVALLCSAWGVRPHASLAKCHRLLVIPLIFAVGAALGDRKAVSDRMVEWAVWAFVAGGACLAIYDMIRVPIEVSRGVGWFDTGNMRDPQMYMVALCLILGLLAGGRLVGSWGVWSGGLLLNAVGLVIHFKRGVWLSFMASVGMMSVLARRWKIVLVMGVCVLSLLFVPKVRERIGAIESEWSVAQGGRVALWTQVAPALLKEHPQGMGFVGTRHEDFLPHAEYVQPKLNHLHNNLLQIAVELGYAGAAIWLAWMAVALLVMWNVRKRAPKGLRGVAQGTFGAFFGLMLNGVVEYNFGDSEMLIVLCCLMGLSYALWLRTAHSS